MKIHELNTAKKKSTKRVGRGISAGQGKTAGRGTKGQNSRTGHSHRPDFEGGQTPLMMSLPKLGGFRSLRTPTENVYTGQLNDFAGKTVDNFVLAEAGITSSAHIPVKVVVKGDLTAKVTVVLQGASENAAAMIVKAGGSFTKVAQVKRPKLTEAKEDKPANRQEAKIAKAMAAPKKAPAKKPAAKK
jgi:large subunit ribosomal protein L15